MFIKHLGWFGPTTGSHVELVGMTHGRVALMGQQISGGADTTGCAWGSLGHGLYPDSSSESSALPGLVSLKQPLEKLGQWY